MENVEAALTDRITALEQNRSSVLEVTKFLKNKVNDLENTSRRKNIRLVGLLEGTEGNIPTEFIADMLFKTVGEKVLQSRLELDQAHRTL